MEIISKSYLSSFFVSTKLQNVAGISNSASQKALDLFLKCQYLDEKTDGKGVVFASGTPLSNSITELHTMMRYLEYGFLSDHGLQHFDNWVSVFGEQKTDWELKPAGNGITVTYGHAIISNKKPISKLAVFQYLPSLMQGHYSYHSEVCRSACNRCGYFGEHFRPHICPQSHIQANPLPFAL